MKTVIIQGSARSQGNTSRIVEYVKSLSDADVIDLLDVPLEDYTYDGTYKDHGTALYEGLLDYDCILLATPVYWYSMSTELKRFLDRMTVCISTRKDIGRAMKGKKIGAICCSSTAEEYPHFFEPFRLTAQYMEMEYLGHVHTYIEDDEIPILVQQKLKEYTSKISKP